MNMENREVRFAELELPPPGDGGFGDAFFGSMQVELSRNIGNYVECEFLIGTQLIQKKEGFLYSVGVSFIVLYTPKDEKYVLCDFYSLKFVTFLTRPPKK